MVCTSAFGGRAIVQLTSLQCDRKVPSTNCEGSTCLERRRFPHYFADAAGLPLVVFTSGTLTARSFAAKGGYRIDVDREFAAFGAANISSALSQGFAVTGADSRTAVGVAAGGRTQVTGSCAMTPT